jgi:hypothetical protein
MDVSHSIENNVIFSHVMDSDASGISQAKSYLRDVELFDFAIER